MTTRTLDPEPVSEYAPIALSHFASCPNPSLIAVTVFRGFLRLSCCSCGTFTQQAKEPRRGRRPVFPKR